MIGAPVIRASAPQIYKAQTALESKRGLYSSVVLAANGDLYFVNDHRFFVRRKGLIEAVRLPVPIEACYAIGPYEDGIAVNVDFDSKGNAVYLLNGKGFRRITNLAHVLSGTSSAGRNIAGTGYATGKGIAYRWSGRWVRLPDCGAGAETRAIDQEGIVLGDVTKGRGTLPCYWDANNALHVLPAPVGLDAAVASYRFKPLMLGLAGVSTDRNGDVQPYRQALIWRDNRLDSSSGVIKGLVGASALSLTFAHGHDLYGTLTPPARPSYARGVLVRKSAVRPLVAICRGHRYIVDSVEGGTARMLIATGHLDDKSKKSPYVSALLTFKL